MNFPRERMRRLRKSPALRSTRRRSGSTSRTPSVAAAHPPSERAMAKKASSMKPMKSTPWKTLVQAVPRMPPNEV